MSSSWSGLLRALGDSFSALVTSEITALRDDLAASRKRLAVAAAIAAAALFVLFWAVGAASVVVFEILANWVSRWLAATIVFVALAVLGAILLRIALKRFESIESPLKTFERRYDEHVSWWNESILAERAPAIESRSTAPTEPEETSLEEDHE